MEKCYQSILKDMNFWRHCDIDSFLGDIRRFISDDILNKYDRILSCGHFPLYRNDSYVNSVYRVVVDNPKYDKVYRSNRWFAFDEWLGMSKFWKKEISGKLYNEIIFCVPKRSRYDFVDAQWEKRGFERTHVTYEYGDGRLYCHYIEKVKMEPQEYAHFEKRKLIPTIDHKIDSLSFPTEYKKSQKILTCQS